MFTTSQPITLHGKIALRDIAVPEHHVPYSSETKVTLGQQTATIPETHSKEEFIAEVNKTKIISCVDTGRWEVAPLQSGYGDSGEPTGVFESADGVRKVVELSGTYTMRDRGVLLTEPRIHFKAGQVEATNEYHNYSGAVTKTTLGNSIAISGPVGLEGIQLAGEKEPVRADSTRSQRVHFADSVDLRAGDRYVTEQSLQAGRFVIPLQSQNEGLIVNSLCKFQIIRHDQTTPLFGFRTRVTLKNVEHATLSNQLPLECEELSIEMVDSKARLIAKTDGVRQILLQGDVNLPADCRLCIHALADCTVPELYWQPMANPLADATICMAIRTPVSASHDVLLSSTAQMKVVSNQLVCNGVATGITLAGSSEYILLYGYVSSTKLIDVYALNMGLNTVQSYVSPSTEAAFTETYAQPTPQLNATAIGEFLWMFSNSDTLEKQALALIGASHYAARLVDLGTLTDGVFSNGGTFASDQITHNGIVYSRIAPAIGMELQTIFGTRSEVIAPIIGNNKPVDERAQTYRVRIVGASLQGSDGESLLFSGTVRNKCLEAQSPHYCGVHSKRPSRVLLSYVDAYSHVEIPIFEHTTGHFLQ